MQQVYCGCGTDAGSAYRQCGVVADRGFAPALNFGLLGNSLKVFLLLENFHPFGTEKNTIAWKLKY